MHDGGRGLDSIRRRVQMISALDASGGMACWQHGWQQDAPGSKGEALQEARTNTNSPKAGGAGQGGRAQQMTQPQGWLTPLGASCAASSPLASGKASAGAAANSITISRSI